MFRKQVKCCNCGFLGLRRLEWELTAGVSLDFLKTLKELDLLGSTECLQIGRDAIANSTHPDPYIFTCARNVWSSSDLKAKQSDDALQFLNSERKCPFFLPYNRGYSPIEHRELQREAKTHALLIKGMILAALIGAVAAIAAQLIVR